MGSKPKGLGHQRIQFSLSGRTGVRFILLGHRAEPQDSHRSLFRMCVARDMALRTAGRGCEEKRAVL